MPITLPVPGGGGATPQQTYYSTTPQFGEYQFVSLNEIINNFIEFSIILPITNLIFLKKM